MSTKIPKVPKVQVYEENIEDVSLQECFDKIQSKLKELADTSGRPLCEAERDNRLHNLYELKVHVLEMYRQKQLEDIEETLKWIIQGCGVSTEFIAAIALLNSINHVGNQIHEAFRKEFERYHN